MKSLFSQCFFNFVRLKLNQTPLKFHVQEINGKSQMTYSSLRDRAHEN